MELERSAAAHAVEAPDIEGYQVVQRRAWEKKYVCILCQVISVWESDFYRCNVQHGWGVVTNTYSSSVLKLSNLLFTASQYSTYYDRHPLVHDE